MKLTLEILQEKGACEESMDRFRTESCFTVELAIKMMMKEKLYDWCNWLLSRMLSNDDKVRYASAWASSWDWDSAWDDGDAGNSTKEKLQRKIIRYGLKMIPKGDI